MTPAGGVADEQSPMPCERITPLLHVVEHLLHLFRRCKADVRSEKVSAPKPTQEDLLSIHPTNKTPNVWSCNSSPEASRQRSDGCGADCGTTSCSARAVKSCSLLPTEQTVVVPAGCFVAHLQPPTATAPSRAWTPVGQPPPLRRSGLSCLEYLEHYQEALQPLTLPEAPVQAVLGAAHSNRRPLTGRAPRSTPRAAAKLRRGAASCRQPPGRSQATRRQRASAHPPVCRRRRHWRRQSPPPAARAPNRVLAPERGRPHSSARSCKPPSLAVGFCTTAASRRSMRISCRLPAATGRCPACSTMSFNCWSRCALAA